MRYLGMAVALAVSASAFADVTFATFADPSSTSSNPVFVHDRVMNTLTGSWSQSGLTLVGPGLTGSPTITNATFSTTPLALTEVVSGVFAVGPGSVVFRDGSNNHLFTINFSSGTYVEGVGAGSSEFRGQDVEYTGPLVPSGTQGRQFNFAFANQVNTQTSTTYTASFTSSAVPEPGTMIALGAGIAAFAARRRRK